MDLTLSKVDYLQVAPISNRRTLKVLPLGKKKRVRGRRAGRRLPSVPGRRPRPAPRSNDSSSGTTLVRWAATASRKARMGCARAVSRVAGSKRPLSPFCAAAAQLEFKLDPVEKEIGCVELGGSVGAKDKVRGPDWREGAQRPPTRRGADIRGLWLLHHGLDAQRQGVLSFRHPAHRENPLHVRGGHQDLHRCVGRWRAAAAGASRLRR